MGCHIMNHKYFLKRVHAQLLVITVANIMVTRDSTQGSITQVLTIINRVGPIHVLRYLCVHTVS